VKSYPKKWGKLFERYLDEYLPERKDEICARADREYRKLLTQMPDVGGKENMMASNMETWFSIVAFYEASGHVIDGNCCRICAGPTMCWRRCCMRGSSGHRQRSWADHTATTSMWATDS
jgi:hypothetical protein